MNANYTQIVRPTYRSVILWPALLPYELGAFVRQHADLVLEGDQMTVAEFASRIKIACSTTRDQAMSNRLTRWYDLMLTLESEVNKTGELPEQVCLKNYRIPTLYDRNTYSRLLGRDAVNYLTREPGQWHEDWDITRTKVAA